MPPKKDKTTTKKSKPTKKNSSKKSKVKNDEVDKNTDSSGQALIKNNNDNISYQTEIIEEAQEYIEVKLGMSPIDIAEEELKQKKIPFMLKRSYGNQVDYWKLEDLFINSN